MTEAYSSGTESKTTFSYPPAFTLWEADHVDTFATAGAATGWLLRSLTI